MLIDPVNLSTRAAFQYYKENCNEKKPVKFTSTQQGTLFRVLLKGGQLYDVS